MTADPAALSFHAPPSSAVPMQPPVEVYACFPQVGGGWAPPPCRLAAEAAWAAAKVPPAQVPLLQPLPLLLLQDQAGTSGRQQQQAARNARSGGGAQFGGYAGADAAGFSAAMPPHQGPFFVGSPPGTYGVPPPGLYTGPPGPGGAGYSTAAYYPQVMTWPALRLACEARMPHAQLRLCSQHPQTSRPSPATPPMHKHPAPGPAAAGLCDAPLLRHDARAAPRCRRLRPPAGLRHVRRAAAPRRWAAASQSCRPRRCCSRRGQGRLRCKAARDPGTFRGCDWHRPATLVHAGMAPGRGGPPGKYDAEFQARQYQAMMSYMQARAAGGAAQSGVGRLWWRRCAGLPVATQRLTACSGGCSSRPSCSRLPHRAAAPSHLLMQQGFGMMVSPTGSPERARQLAQPPNFRRNGQVGAGEEGRGHVIGCTAACPGGTHRRGVAVPCLPASLVCPPPTWLQAHGDRARVPGRPSRLSLDMSASKSENGDAHRLDPELAVSGLWALLWPSVQAGRARRHCHRPLAALFCSRWWRRTRRRCSRSCWRSSRPTATAAHGACRWAGSVECIQHPAGWTLLMG